MLPQYTFACSRTYASRLYVSVSGPGGLIASCVLRYLFMLHRTRLCFYTLNSQHYHLTSTKVYADGNKAWAAYTFEVEVLPGQGRWSSMPRPLLVFVKYTPQEYASKDFKHWRLESRNQRLHTHTHIFTYICICIYIYIYIYTYLSI